MDVPITSLFAQGGEVEDDDNSYAPSVTSSREEESEQEVSGAFVAYPAQEETGAKIMKFGELKGQKFEQVARNTEYVFKIAEATEACQIQARVHRLVQSSLSRKCH